MLECRNLSKTYCKGNSEEIDVLSNLNLKIDQGEIVALKGSSGTGKTTLLNLVSGLDSPSSGKVIFKNKTITDYDANQLSLFRRNHIGIIFQFFNLINDLSTIENISLPLMIRGQNKLSSISRGLELATSVNLNTKINYPVQLLSGGEAQRVSVARAMITNPDLILADEPTGNLDVTNSNLVIDCLINQCKKNNTSLFLVTHNENILNKFDRVLKLENGIIS
tara:strand:+ start:1290 stop:1955 length:666 start_codon:yes stop_codon:yes gene_type:complete